MGAERASGLLRPGHGSCLIPDGAVVPVPVGPTGRACAFAIDKQLPDVAIESGPVDPVSMMRPARRDGDGAVQNGLLSCKGCEADGIVFCALEPRQTNRFGVSTLAQVACVTGPEGLAGSLYRAERPLPRAGIGIVSVGGHIEHAAFLRLAPVARIIHTRRLSARRVGQQERENR